MSDLDKSIFYRSSGLICGKYLPSEGDLVQGVLMTDEGLFSATLNQRVLEFLTWCSGSGERIPSKRTIRRKHHFVCWIYGLPEAPYYQLHLIDRKNKKKFSKLLPGSNIFLSQGIVMDRISERVVLRVQKNPRPDRNSQEIEDSINHLEIRGCPGKVRTSQFWLIYSRFKDGFLHYQSGELLAKAEVAKSYLKIP